MQLELRVSYEYVSAGHVCRNRGYHNLGIHKYERAGTGEFARVLEGCEWRRRFFCTQDGGMLDLLVWDEESWW